MSQYKLSDSIESKLYIVGSLLALVGIVTRIMGLGWLGIIGIVSIIIFLPIHIYYLCLDKTINVASFKQQLFLTVPVVLFPFIFLFQPDFGDSGEITVMIELIIGNKERYLLENYSWVLATIIAIFYSMATFFTIAKTRKVK